MTQPRKKATRTSAHHRLMICRTRFQASVRRAYLSQNAKTKIVTGTRATCALWFVLALAACATPTERFEAWLQARDLAPGIVAGDGFHHLLIERNQDAVAARLHVYIEGDGAPWLTPTVPAVDPTPVRPLALELALLDPGPAIYLGRPCYLGVRDPGCEVGWWTDRRYAEEIVRSLAAAVEDYARARNHRRVVIIGHSGGGVLALLLAERLPAVERVVTLGANLDLAAWTRTHRYSPLTGSLDPATRRPSARVRETHYVGGRDHNVPPALVRAAVARRGAGEIIELPDYDHRCCWVRLWPRVLAELRSADRQLDAP
jgi:pimeloyl-ACP methyl ester carboxylesterase